MNWSAVAVLAISLLLTLTMSLYIISVKKKTRLHYTILFGNSVIIVWGICAFLETYYFSLGNVEVGTIFEYATYIGASLTPIMILLVGKYFANNEPNPTWMDAAFFVIPIISITMALTNNYHHLFYSSFTYTIYRPEIIVGPYFYIHSLYSYACLVTGIYRLINSAIKNTGLLSAQAMLVIIGTAVPFIVNVFYTLGIGDLNVYSTPVAFSFAMICWMFAMFRFGFMKITPIALKTIIDMISDSFIVVDTNLGIVDYNKSFLDIFSDVVPFALGDNFLNKIEQNAALLKIVPENLKRLMDDIQIKKKMVSLDYSVYLHGKIKYFEIEITPMETNGNYVGSIILLHDVTQRKIDQATIEENRTIMIERDRLVSLGQLVGGISHNLKTPILTMSSGLSEFMHLTQEYKQSIGDPEVTNEDHLEIVKEMEDWIKKMKNYLSYMSDLISTVKDQASQINTNQFDIFTVNELIHRVDLLMKHELIKRNCEMIKEVEIDLSSTLLGDVNSLVQVFDNIIVNAIHAYDGKRGKIVLKILYQGDNIVFSIKDFAGGIDKKVAGRIFKEMVTTKGKSGTGIGLYLSYSTIKAMFRGNLWFNTEEGSGTEFVISIPQTKTGGKA